MESKILSLGEPMRSVAGAFLEKGELFPEEISECLGLPFQSILTAISLLELQGIVKKLSGGRFTLKYEQ